MESRTTKLVRHALHARPAADFATLAQKQKGDVSISHRGRTVNAKSVLALLLLKCHQGDEITIYADGPDAAATLDELVAFVAGPAEQSRSTDPRGGPNGRE